MPEGLNKLIPETEEKRRLWHLENIVQPMTEDRVKNIFTFRPRPGDIWLVRYSYGKRKKWVDDIGLRWVRKNDGTDYKKLYVSWQRQPKGRYSGAFVRALLKHGRLIFRKLSKEEFENAKSSLCKEGKKGGSTRRDKGR